jgi:hypothetical protein
MINFLKMKVALFRSLYLGREKLMRLTQSHKSKLSNKNLPQSQILR